jgi:uncharacterized membrane protein
MGCVVSCGDASTGERGRRWSSAPAEGKVSCGGAGLLLAPPLSGGCQGLLGVIVLLHITEWRIEMVRQSAQTIGGAREKAKRLNEGFEPKQHLQSNQ